MKKTIPYIDAHTHRFQSDENHRCFHTYRHGIHPWLVKHPLTVDQLNSLRFNPPPYLGEVGVDRTKGIAAELQLNIFSQYLDLAKELDLPLIVHCVHALSDIAQALKQISYHRVLLHGFTGNAEQVKMLARFGCFFSLGAELVKNAKLQETIKHIPLDKLLFETDDQEEVSIELIYQQASSILDIEPDELKALLYQNALTFFGPSDEWKKMD